MLRIALLTLAALLCAAWLSSLITKTGVLVWSATYYVDDIYNIDPTDHGAPTYGPVGQRCVYLIFSGTQDVFLVETGEHEVIASEIMGGGNVDAWVRRATIVTTPGWSEACPATFDFRAR